MHALGSQALYAPESRVRRATLMNAVQYEAEALRDLAKRTRDLAGRARLVHRREHLLALAECYEAKADEIEREAPRDGRPLVLTAPVNG